MVEAALRGSWAASDTTMPTEELEGTDDPALRVRAELIRELLMGLRGELDPRGLRIQAVRVIGELDLDHITAITGLTLAGCALPDGITCTQARLREVNLNGCRISGLRADALRTDGSMFLRHTTVIGTDDRGAVWMPGAHIGGQLNLHHAQIINDTAPALGAAGLRTDNDMVLADVTVTGAGDRGAVWMPGAHIGGNFHLDHAHITNHTGPALYADHLHTDTSMSLLEATIRGIGESAAVRLLGARIGGDLNLDHAEITNDTGPALGADDLRTDRNMVMADVAVIGTGELGAVRLLGAHIGGQLNIRHAEITNHSGSALHAEGLHTENSASLFNATMIGTAGQGAVRLSGAHIGRYLDLDHAEITNDTGPALKADDLRTDIDMFMRAATMIGTGELGAVRLSGAHIGGQLRLDGIRVDNESGPLIELSETQVMGSLSLPASVACPHSRAEISRKRCPDGERQIAVRGLVFPILAEASWQQWLHLLMHHTPSYTPQPYQQLATVESGAGHDNNARHVLIAQQEDLRRRNPEAVGGRLAQTRHWLWGWLGRYGYRAHRLVIALTLVLGLAAGLGVIAGQVTTRPSHHAAERVLPLTAPADAPGTRCSIVELIGLGIDRGLPLGATGLRARCDLDTGTRWGQAITVAIWALQALVWALATLAIAAYTGLVRKPT